MSEVGSSNLFQDRWRFNCPLSDKSLSQDVHIKKAQNAEPIFAATMIFENERTAKSETVNLQYKLIDIFMGIDR